MTDREKLIAYKAAYKDLLAAFFDHYNATAIFNITFCEVFCPVGTDDCDFDCFDLHRCTEKILAEYSEDEQ